MARVTLSAIIDADTKKFNAAIDSAQAKLKELGNERTIIAGLGVAAAASSAQLLSLGNQATNAAKALISISPAALVMTAQAGTVLSLALKSDTAAAEQFKKKWEEVGTVLTKASTTVLPGLNKMMDLLKTNLPVVAKGFQETGKVLGDLATAAGKALSGPLFRAELAQIMEANNVSISGFGAAAVKLLAPLTDLVAVGAQVLAAFSQSLPLWADQLAAYTAAERASGSLGEKLQTGMNNLVDFARAIFNLAALIKNVMEAANTASGDTIGKLADSLARLKAVTEDGTPGREKLIQFFEAVNNIGAGVYDILLGIGEAAVTFFQALTGGNADLMDFSESIRQIGEDFREWANSQGVRNEIIEFAERMRITFDGLSQIFNAVGQELSGLSDNSTVEFFRELAIAVAASELTLLAMSRLVPGFGLALSALSPQIRIIGAAIAFLGTSSDEIVQPLAALGASIGKLVTAVLDGTEPIFEFAAALAGLALEGVASLVGGLATALSGLSGVIQPLAPWIIAFGAAWAAMAFASWIAGMGGLTVALYALGRATGVVAVIHALQTAFIALEVVGGTLIPTLFGVRAALLGLATVTGVVAVLGLIVYGFIQLTQEGERAREAVDNLLSGFDVTTVQGVTAAIDAVNLELSKLRNEAEIFKTATEGRTIWDLMTGGPGVESVAIQAMEAARAGLMQLDASMEASRETARSTTMTYDEFNQAIGANAEAVDGSIESIQRFGEELLTGTTNLNIIATQFGVTSEEAFALADALGIDLQSNMNDVVAATQTLGPAIADAGVMMGLTAQETILLTQNMVDLGGDAAVVADQLATLSDNVNGIAFATDISSQGIIGLATALQVDLVSGANTANEAMTEMGNKLRDEVPLAGALTAQALNNIGIAALTAKGDIDLMNLTLNELANQNNLQLQLATTALRIQQFAENTTLARDSTGAFSLTLVENEVAVRGTIAGMLSSVQELYNQKLATEGATAAAEAATTQFEEFTTQLFAAVVAQGGNTTELQRMFEQLGITIGNDGSGVRGLSNAFENLPDDVSIPVETPGIQDAIANARELSQVLNETPRELSIRVTRAVTTYETGMTSGAGAGSGGLSPRALGGPVEANMPFLVGEEGPELFVPKANGEIVTASKTKQLLEASGQATAPAQNSGAGDFSQYESGLDKLAKSYDEVRGRVLDTTTVLVNLNDNMWETDRQTLLLGDEISRTERQGIQWNETLSAATKVVGVATEANAALTVGIQDNTVAGEENYLGLTNLATQMDVMNTEQYPVMLESKTLDTAAQVENTLATTENLVSQTELGNQMILMTEEQYPLMTEATIVQSTATAENTVFNAENLVSLIDNATQLTVMSGETLPVFTEATNASSEATTAFSATQVEAMANVNNTAAAVVEATGIVNEYTAATEAVPPAVETVYTTPGLLDAIANTNALSAAQAGVERNITVTYTTNFVNNGAPASFAGGFASGGEIGGFGGATADNYVAAVSSREWVINAAVSQRQGRAKMAALNAGAADIVTGGEHRGAGTSVISINGPLVSVAVTSNGGDSRDLANVIGNIIDEKVEEILEDIVNSIDAGIRHH